MIQCPCGAWEVPGSEYTWAHALGFLVAHDGHEPPPMEPLEDLAELGRAAGFEVEPWSRGGAICASEADAVGFVRALGRDRAVRTGRVVARRMRSTRRVR